MARRSRNSPPPERDSLLGAAILSLALHAGALVATVVVWPYVAPPLIPQPDVVMVDLDVADETNVTAQAKSEEPEPEPVPPPETPPPPPEFEEPAPPPPPEIVEAIEAVEPEEQKPPELAKPEPPQQRFAMAAPRAKPKPEPKKPDFDLTDITKAIDRAEKQQTKSEERPAPSASKVALKGAGAQTALTMSEIDALRSQMAKCWNVPVGAPDPTALVLRVRVFLNEDGSIDAARPPQLVDQGRMGDPYFRAAADSAIRAVHICGPYNLPAEKYALWNEIVITFDPRQMAGY